MSAQPIEILTRPFAIRPSTRMMTTDGVVVADAGPVELGVYLVNRTDQALEDVDVSAAFDEPSRIPSPPRAVRVERMLPGTPALVTFAADPSETPAGIFELALDVHCRAADGSIVHASPK